MDIFLSYNIFLAHIFGETDLLKTFRKALHLQAYEQNFLCACYFFSFAEQFESFWKVDTLT